MTASTMNISLPESLKRFVQKRSKSANYSNPSDYMRALIREDQRREAAERLLDEVLQASRPANVQAFESEFWSRWNLLKSDIDRGIASLSHDGGRLLDEHLVADVKRRGRERLARSKHT
jgi:antitoxin ParD1/3/4